MVVSQGIGYQRGDRENGFKIEFIDIRRAYFHAKARRRVLVKLPKEDAKEGNCGLLSKASTEQGTQPRTGSTNMQSSWKRMDSKEVWRSRVHGDDFTILGLNEDLD